MDINAKSSPVLMLEASTRKYRNSGYRYEYAYLMTDVRYGTYM